MQTFKRLYLVGLVIFVQVGVSSPAESARKNGGDGGSASLVQRVSRAHLEFALRLYHRLAADLGPNENLAISPHR